MKAFCFIFAGLWLILHNATSETIPVRYDNYKVFRVNIPNDMSADFILNLPSYVDIWAEPRVGHHSDIMVAPQHLQAIEDNLKRANMDYSIMIQNVQTLIDIQNTKISKELIPKARAGHPMTWDEYHSLADIEAYMYYLVETFPDIVSIEEIGTTYEGREMRVLKICKGGVCGQKPGIWVDGGIHSREWVAMSTATFMMEELVENSDQYPAELLEKLDWYILPVLNPDGYEYSRTSHRFWRKSRYVSDINI